jgi:hypothetical protein
MAQSASLAEAKAIQARQNLEKYVFGTAVSTVPPVVSPSIPAALAKYPSYPYVSSPMQWDQGAVPLSVSLVGSTATLTLLSVHDGIFLRNFSRGTDFL